MELVSINSDDFLKTLENIKKQIGYLIVLVHPFDNGRIFKERTSNNFTETYFRVVTSLNN